MRGLVITTHRVNFVFMLLEKCSCKKGVSIRRQVQIANRVAGNYQLQGYQFEGKPVYKKFAGTTNLAAADAHYLFYGASDGGVTRWRVEKTLGKRPGKGWVYSQPDARCPEDSANTWGYGLTLQGDWISSDVEERIYVDCLESSKYNDHIKKWFNLCNLILVSHGLIVIT